MTAGGVLIADLWGPLQGFLGGSDKFSEAARRTGGGSRQRFPRRN